MKKKFIKIPNNQSIASKLRATITSFTKMKEELEMLETTALSAITAEEAKIVAAQAEKEALEGTLASISAVKGNIEKIIEPIM